MFQTRGQKSRAELAFQVMGGGNLISSFFFPAVCSAVFSAGGSAGFSGGCPSSFSSAEGVFASSFIALVIKLPWEVTADRLQMKNPIPPPASKMTAPMTSAVKWLMPELSSGGATFGGGPFVSSLCAETALVGLTGSVSVIGASSVTTGGGALVAAVLGMAGWLSGGGAGAGAGWGAGAAGGATLGGAGVGVAGAGAGVGAGFGGGAATALVSAGAPAVSCAEVVNAPATRMMAQI